jgi:hypothetical protein
MAETPEPSARRRRGWAWFLALLLLAGFVTLVAVSLWERVRVGKGLPAYSIYSQQRDGLGELVQLLDRLGMTPIALTRPVQQTTTRGVLIVAGMPAHAYAESEARGLLRWVEQGNTLLLCGADTTAIHHALNLRLQQEPIEEEAVPVDLEPLGAYTEGIRRLSVEQRTSVQGRPGLPLWTIDNQPGARVLVRGKGRVLVLADPSLLTRRGLLRDDNALFMVQVLSLHAQKGEVYFDEYHHGFQSAGGFWGYLAHHGQQSVGLPLLLAAGAGVWLWAVRLGPAVPTPPPAGADAVDYASALARLYQQTRARRLLGRTLARGFLDRLRHHLHLRRTALPVEVLAAWGQQHPGPTVQRLHRLLDGVNELQRGEVAEQQLLSWARAFDQFQVEVLHEE